MNAILFFEFRSVPNVLSEFVPKTEIHGKVDVKARIILILQAVKPLLLK